MSRRLPAVSRRTLMVAAGAHLLAATVPVGVGRALAAPSPGSLGAMAAEKGLLFGASLAVAQLGGPDGERYADVYRRETSIITTEIELKMHELRRAPGAIDFSGADRFFEFAEKNGILARGHTLIWHDYLPDWIKRLPPAKARELLTTHIAAVMGRYRGRAHSYDVVNEPIAPWDRRQDKLRAGPFLAGFGEDYIARSFELARRADPRARLVLNEAQMEASSRRGAEFRTGFLALLHRLKRRGTPIDAIGFQGHLSAAASYEFKQFADYISGIGELGYDIYITELDVNDDAYPDNIAERDKRVAQLYRDFLGAVLQVRAVKLLTLWQLVDTKSWLHDLDVHRYPRRRRRPRPLLYDGNFDPKPSWHAVADALKTMPAR